MIHEMWRLSEGGDDNLGLALTPDGLALGRTWLIERRDDHFVVRDQHEIARLLGKAYNGEIAVDRLMAGLVRVAAALNAGDRCLAAIAAVHLKLRDLPNKFARDDLETIDTLIKYGDWNPELHPRTGTPPNPGWFGPTGGDGGSSSVHVAQNDDPNRRSDASPAPTDNWVRLKPGPKRVDELADFVEWLANSTPADEQAIRAEIKRYFYDSGDAGSAALLNSALSVVLRPGTTQETRKKILNSLDVHTRADPRDYVPIRDLLTGGAIAVSPMLPGAGKAPPGGATAESTTTAATESAATAATEGAVAEASIAIRVLQAWKYGWAKRGRLIHEWLSDESLGPNFPVIDNFSKGMATSIKSIDLNAATYQNSASLTYRINSYVDKLSEFNGARWGKDFVDAADILDRTLNLVVPKGSMTEMQRNIINTARTRAEFSNSRRRVKLVITEL